MAVEDKSLSSSVTSPVATFVSSRSSVKLAVSKHIDFYKNGESSVNM